MVVSRSLRLVVAATFFTGFSPWVVGSDSIVYWSEGGSIKRSSINQPAIETVISGLSEPWGVSANNLCEEKLFWTDIEAELAGCSGLDGSNPQQTPSSLNPVGIAVHPRTRTVYWSVSSGTDRIYRATFELTNPTMVVSMSSVQMGPVRIAGETLYWVVQECPGGECLLAVFHRSRLDGANQETLFSLPNTRVTDFFVDLPNGRIYWATNLPSHTIFRGNLDGTGAVALRAVNESFPNIAQEPTTGRILWSDVNGFGLWRILVGDADAQNAVVVVNNLPAQPAGLSVVLSPMPLTDCDQNGEEDACQTLAEDCQGNGIPDSCDIASGASADCDANGVPDECGPDCQPNGVLDTCEIDSGASEDCNSNATPDECEPDCNGNSSPDDCDVASGFSADCNANSSPDECDLIGNDCNSNGIPDSCDFSPDTDCDGNGTLDSCEPADPDCNDNNIHDICDITSGFSQDDNGDGFPDECFAGDLAIPLPDPTGISKCRFISFVLPAEGAGENLPTALRIRMVSLHHVVPPYAGAPTIPFDLFEGMSVWVGPPSVYPESSSRPDPFNASRTQCAPHYRNWSTVGLLHVTGVHVVPSSVYEVQQVSVLCQGNEETCMEISPPLEIRTTRWGDVETPFNPPSSTVQPDVADVSALVNKFRSAPGAPIKARAFIAGVSGEFWGDITTQMLGIDLGLSHIAACVDAFRGMSYRYKMGLCANSSAACSANADCGANGPCELYCPD